MLPINWLRWVFGTAVVCAGLFCGAVSLEAGETHWIGDDGDWNNADNWDAGVPVDEDEARLDQAGDYIVNYVSAFNPVLNLVQIEAGMELRQNQDDLSTLSMQVGSDGLGYYSQSGGTVTIGSATTNGALYIGNWPGSEGYYTQTNGTTTIVAAQDNQAKMFLGFWSGSKGTYVLGELGVSGSNPQLIKQHNETFVGMAGEGYFYHNSGTHTFSGAMYLGDTGYGYYEMNGGMLNNNVGEFGGIILGEWGGTGEFNHQGGEVDVTDLTLARQDGSTGNYTLAGDAFLTLADFTVVGAGGTGTFDHSGSAVHETGALVVGDGDYVVNPPGRSGNGTYELYGEGQLVVNRETTIGQLGGTGTFNQRGNSIHETNELVVGGDTKEDGTGGSAIYNLSENATLTVHGGETIGLATSGTFNQYDAGTTHTIHGELWVDATVASKGVFNLHDGSLQVDKTAYIGSQAFATGEFNQFGGTAHIDEDLVVGVWGDNTGYVSLSGGTMTAAGVQVGYLGYGTLNMSDGAHLQSDWAELGVFSGGVANVTLTNNGSGNNTVWNAGAEMSIGGQVLGNGGTATLDLFGAENHIRVVNSTNDAGLLRIWDGGELRMKGGNGRVSVGSDILSTPGHLWIASGGVLDMRGGTVSADLIEVGDGGQLFGNGMLDVDEVNVSGLLSPGSSPGLLELADDSMLFFQPGATCEMGIEGTGAGQYDLLKAGGNSTVHFDGLLVLRFSGSFVPGDLITLFDFSGFENDFASIQILGLDPTLAAEFNVLNGQVAITPEPVTLALLVFGGLAFLRGRNR